MEANMTDGLSAVDCLRKALKNLRELLKTVDSAYDSSLKYVYPSILPTLPLGSSSLPSSDLTGGEMVMFG